MQTPVASSYCLCFRMSSLVLGVLGLSQRKIDVPENRPRCEVPTTEGQDIMEHTGACLPLCGTAFHRDPVRLSPRYPGSEPMSRGHSPFLPQLTTPSRPWTSIHVSRVCFRGNSLNVETHWGHPER